MVPVSSGHFSISPKLPSKKADSHTCSYLISATSCLLTSYFFFQSLASTSFVMIWKETCSVSRSCSFEESRNDLPERHQTEALKASCASCWMSVIKACTSSLMRVRTACFSASLMQMESRTWLPVFTISLPPDLFISLQVSSYCWGQREISQVSLCVLLYIRFLRIEGIVCRQHTIGLLFEPRHNPLYNTAVPVSPVIHSMSTSKEVS